MPAMYKRELYWVRFMLLKYPICLEKYLFNRELGPARRFRKLAEAGVENVGALSDVGGSKLRLDTQSKTLVDRFATVFHAFVMLVKVARRDAHDSINRKF